MKVQKKERKLYLCTVWNPENFHATDILREINFDKIWKFIKAGFQRCRNYKRYVADIGTLYLQK